ncbi:sugar phosphate isomerase/epimerase [Candidatus Woesearchaeota archaeon]|nr:sugar phosphate isomerase/epimerase [Candidatus Woesearchaeota archaeon]
MEGHKTSHNWALGAPTNPTIARQLEEFGKLLNQGIKNIEIGTISGDKFEQIPEQHFEEVRRLAKLTDAKISVHAPLLDLAGFQENRWREEQRGSTEQQVFSILERSHKLSNGENVPVVFHAGNVVSQEYGVPWDPKTGPQGPGLKKEMYIKDEKGNIILDENNRPKTKLEPTELRAITVINQDTGELTVLSHEEKYRLDRKDKEIWDVDKRLESLNQTQWDKEKLQILNYQKEVEDLKEKLMLKIKQNDAIEKTGLKEDQNYQDMHHQNGLEIQRISGHIDELNKILSSEYQNTYDKFMKFGKDEEKKKFEEGLKKLQEENKPIQEKMLEIKKDLEEKEGLLEKARNEQEKSMLEKERDEKLINLSNLASIKSKQIVNALTSLDAPELWRPVGEFAIEKTAQTVSGAIARLYEKLKKEGREKETPFIAMENFFVHSPMSRAKDLKKAVELSREKLAEELKTKCELSEKQAKKEAEKLIGATWDVGHINNLRKAGYEGEELKKKVIEETKEIADVTRHVHITDNFGFFDSHLPPGMGNVPIREIMEELEKTWAKQAEEGRLIQKPRGIVEAGGFVAEIGQNPTLGIMEFFGSPLYKLSSSPHWKGFESGGVAFRPSPYTESFIEFPQQHFNLYGSSFTTLPKTLGGQVSGEQSRFSGTPNQ